MANKVSSLDTKRAAKEASPAAAATAMSPEETAEVFGGEAPTTAPQLPKINPADLKGALLTQERMLFYTRKEDRTSKYEGREPYTVYWRGPLVIGVYPQSAIVDDEIEGLMSDAPAGA